MTFDLINRLIKSFIILLLLLHLASNNALAQDISKKYPVLIKQVKSIKSDTSFEKVNLTNEEFMPHPTDGGGELTGYYKKGQIQKIVRSIGLSVGIENYEYYFANGKLIFIYETFEQFVQTDSSGTLDPTQTEETFIGRYYFKNQKLTDSETTGHNRFERDDINMEKTLLNETKENLRLLTKKKHKTDKS